MILPAPTCSVFMDRQDRDGCFGGGVKTVAQAGYRGFRRGRSLVIPGLMNKLLAFCVRFLPRAWVSKVTKRLPAQRDRLPPVWNASLSPWRIMLPAIIMGSRCVGNSNATVPAGKRTRR